MAWTVELYDKTTNVTYDITSRTIQITVDERIDNETNTFKLSCFGIQEVHKFHVVTIKLDNVTKFKGIIMKQSDSDGGTYKITEFECFDYSYFFTVRVVAQTYQNKSIDYILKDIVSKYIPELTTTNVIPTTTSIDNLQFQYVGALEAVKKIFEHVYDFHWYVDSSKDVHLFYQYETIGPKVFMSSMIDNSLRVSYEGDQVANRVWIVGSKLTDPNYIDQYFTGDGQQRYFTLAYEPNYYTIYLDGVAKNTKLEQNDDNVQDFLINKKNKVLIIPPNIGTPHSGSIKAHYRPSKQLIDYYENPTDIANYWLIEKAIRNKDITDKLSARKFGQSEVKRKSVTRRLVSFSSREEFKVGQKCTLNVTSSDLNRPWSVIGNFLVVSVSTQITTGDMIYTVNMEEVI